MTQRPKQNSILVLAIETAEGLPLMLARNKAALLALRTVVTPNHPAVRGIESAIKLIEKLEEQERSIPQLLNKEIGQ